MDGNRHTRGEYFDGSPATMETGRRGAQSMGSGSNESIQEGFLEGMTSE